MNDSVSSINITDNQYPALLKEIHDPPQRIFIRGQLPPKDALCLSVVGTRHMTRYGLHAVETLVPPLARLGVVIVSGLAFGVDAAAHRATLSANGYTVAILPGGIDDASIAPSTHRTLAHEILEHGGCLLSECLPGTKTHKGSFPIRNRLIAGMSKATLIIESTCASGTMVTAAHAVSENRDVLAVPGNINAPYSQGPLTLLSRGAILIRSFEDLALVLGIEYKTGTPREVTQELQPLYDVLQSPHTVDDLAIKLHRPAQDILARITQLELQGLVRSTDAFSYVRI